MKTDLFNKIKDEAKGYFLNAKGSHDWDHVERVYSLCIEVGKKENADLEILQLSSILHDIGRKEEDDLCGKICHAETGAVLARELLGKYGIEKDKIEKVAHCIETHRFRNNKVPESKEAKVLFDADKLDSIGAVGIGRAFLFKGEIGGRLYNKESVGNNVYQRTYTAYDEFVIKLSKVKDRMFTQEGKRIAEERHKFMVDFFDRLDKEVDGIL